MKHKILIEKYENVNRRCASNVTAIVAESGIDKPSSNYGRVCSVYFHTRALWKCYNLLSTAKYG